MKIYRLKPNIIEAASVSTTSVSPSIPISPISEDVSISVTPRQLYTKDDVIQEREDLAPSQLRRKKNVNGKSKK